MSSHLSVVLFSVPQRHLLSKPSTLKVLSATAQIAAASQNALCCPARRIQYIELHCIMIANAGTMQDLFSDPVIAADDNTYERAAITEWLVKKGTSPMTNLPLEHLTLVPNTKLKDALHALLKQLSPERHADLAS